MNIGSLRSRFVVYLSLLFFFCQCIPNELAQASQGVSFGAMGANSSYAWDSATKQWYGQTVTGAHTIVSLNGDVGVIGSLNNAYVWSSDTKLWSPVTVGTLLDIVGSLFPLLPSGDFDLDGDVDGADFLKWQRGENTNPPNASDLADWETTFGTVVSSSAASTSVPEPTTAIMLPIGLATLLSASGYRRHFHRSFERNVLTLLTDSN